MPADWLARWQAPQPHPQLHLPAANPFVSTDFDLQKVISLHCLLGG